MTFHKDVLGLDADKEAQRVADFIRAQVAAMRREGTVVGLSGGIDSALVAALCVKALGKDRVYGLILPERDSNPVSAVFAKKHAQQLGIRHDLTDITPTLQAFGTYAKRDDAIQNVLPGYDSSWKIKITLPPDLLARDAFNIFTLTAVDNKGTVKSARLGKAILNAIVAATNSKLRTRMIHLYFAAEKMNYLVCGTTNKSESLQGFFVKYGDGGVDIEPIVHLYKTQVYQLARLLGVTEEIINRAPSPDTFSFAVSDEEFYFRMPYDILDRLLWAWEKNVARTEVEAVLGLSEEQVKRAFRDFAAKSATTAHLRLFPPSLA